MPVDELRSTRSDSRGALLIAAGLALAWIAAAVSESRTPSSPTDRVTWRRLAPARAASREAGRPLLLFVTDEEALSSRLEREIFGDKRLATQIEKQYVLSRVVDRPAQGGTRSAEIDELLRRCACTELPCLVVLEADGSHRTFQRYPGRGRAAAFLLAGR